MIESVERRFGLVDKLPQRIEWLSDNVTRRPPLMVDRALRYSTERTLYVKSDKARRELGYEPGAWLPAIEDAVRWFKVERAQVLKAAA